MKRGLLIGLVALAVLAAAPALWFASEWFVPTTLKEERTFIVPEGASLTAVAAKLEQEGFVASADRFLLGTRLFGSSDPIKAGEFLLPVPGGGAQILGILQRGDVVRRFVTVPEGMPSILVRERLLTEELLTGPVDTPAEGSVLPDSYAYERGEARSTVLVRMQQAMSDFIAAEWPKRDKELPVRTPEEALALAAIVEKETGVAGERRLVAGLYTNRLRKGMRLQADPTIIYPITRGKPLGRRIRRSEIAAVNGYNTYAMAGLPRGPITNPGRESILAVLHPADTRALYMVADGSGGHAFAETLAEHNANVAKWFAVRRDRGELD